MATEYADNGYVRKKIIGSYGGEMAGPADAKQDRYGAGPAKTTTQIVPYDGLSISSLFGGSPLSGAYTAQARPAATLRTPTNTANGTIVANKDQSRLPENAFGYGASGNMTGANPAVSAIDSAAPRVSQLFSLPGGGRLTGSGTPNYGGYRATPRMANPSPLIPGPAYVPQPAGLDPWSGLRAPGEVVPAAAPGMAQGGGLLQTIADLFAPMAPISAEQASSMRSSPDYNADQIKALEQGKKSYSPSPGLNMPTMAPGGKPRKTYGDGGSSSPYGSGGSLV